MLVPDQAAIVASEMLACRQQLTNVCRLRYGVEVRSSGNCGKSAATWRTIGRNSRSRQLRAWSEEVTVGKARGTQYRGLVL
jgi:hypothetical protein